MATNDNEEPPVTPDEPAPVVAADDAVSQPPMDGDDASEVDALAGDGETVEEASDDQPVEEGGDDQEAEEAV